VLRALEAATQARAKRFVLLSVPGADPETAHPFLRAKGLAEEAVRASGLQHAIVRATHAYGLGGLWFTAAVEGALAEPPIVVGPGDTELAPVFVEDVASVIAGIDDAQAELAGTWGLEGPDVVTADGFAGMLLGVPFDAVTASFFALPSRADGPDAALAFGVSRTPLVDGLRVTLAEAAAVDTG